MSGPGHAPGEPAWYLCCAPLSLPLPEGKLCSEEFPHGCGRLPWPSEMGRGPLGSNRRQGLLWGAWGWSSSSRKAVEHATKFRAGTIVLVVTGFIARRSRIILVTTR